MHIFNTYIEFRRGSEIWHALGNHLLHLLGLNTDSFSQLHYMFYTPSCLITHLWNRSTVFIRIQHLVIHNWTLFSCLTSGVLLNCFRSSQFLRRRLESFLLQFQILAAYVQDYDGDCADIQNERKQHISVSIWIRK